MEPGLEVQAGRRRAVRLGLHLRFGAVRPDRNRLAGKGQQAFDWRFAVGSAVSAALHLAYSLTLQAGYDRAELGVVYPVAPGTGPVLTMLFALFLLGERLTTVAMLGALLVVVGILVVTGNPFRRGSSRPLQEMIWGAATGATIAGYTLWDS